MRTFLSRSTRAMAFVAAILFLAASFPRPAFAIDSPAEIDEADFPDLAAAFRKHCVRVYIYGKSHQGKTPEVGDFAADIRNERPTPLGGYWWDANHVIIEDPVIHDQFIRSIEIGLPFSDLRYPARIAGRFVTLHAILIEVLPRDGLMPQAFPLKPVDGDMDEAPALSYLWENGGWRVKGDMWQGPMTVSDAGEIHMRLSATGIVVSPDGETLGIAFGDRVRMDDAMDDWSGETARRSPIVAADETETFSMRMRDRLRSAVLETRFRLRVKIDDDDEDDSWAVNLGDQTGQGETEVKAAGLVVGPRHLFVPLPLEAEAIARIEEIGVVTPEAGMVKARFAGACRNYQAVVIETEEDLPTGELPRGFTMLNPFVVPAEAFDPGDPADSEADGKFFYRWRVDYALGRRRETVDYDRWLGRFRGYRGDTVVSTVTNEEDGALAFDLEGKLIALSLTPRVLQTSGGTKLKASAGFRPLAFIQNSLHRDDVFDPSLGPVDEEEGRRLVDLGVEYQGLDANTARLFHAAAETRGGKIGMLVTHVYPGSTADQLGLREHDILLRLFLEGRAEPVELKGDDAPTGSSLIFEDMSTESIQQLLSFMPPPWPSRENTLSTLLTAAGAGRRARLEYIREGEALRAEFVTDYTEPDYRNAPKKKFDSLGITVKPITYEVARYFRRPDRAGVIVSKAEVGGKGSVAGMHPYLLITHVDGSRVEGLDDFGGRIAAFEKGDAQVVELTVEAFGKTRLVKIEQR